MAGAVTGDVCVGPAIAFPIHPLRLRSDQVFSEVRATLSDTFLDLVHHDRHALFDRLQSETGVRLDNKENNHTCVVRGRLDQILLAKLKLETYILDIQDKFLQTERDTPSGDNGDFRLTTDNLPLALHKIKTEVLDDEDMTDEICGQAKKAKLSHAAGSSGNISSPILAGLIGLRSRRKVGRPRKFDSGLATGSNPGLLMENRASHSNSPVDLQDLDYIPELDLPSSPQIANSPLSDSYRPLRNTNGGRTVMEEEAERKAAEWLSVGANSSKPVEASIDEDEDKKDSLFEYSCELCNFKATREGQFLKHVLIHGKQDTVHKCDKCNFASVSMNHVNRHRLSHSDSIFKCPQCSFLTDEAKSLARHVTLKHTMVADSLPKGSGMLQCNDCSYQTTKIYHFERHLLVHNRDLKGLLQVYHCDLCPYKTHRKEHFLRHRDNVHLRNRPYQCRACSRSYKKEDALRQHERTVHNRGSDGNQPSPMDGASDDTGKPADLYSNSPGETAAPPVITQTTTRSGASISIIPSPISGTSNGRTSYSSLRSSFFSGSSSVIPSLIAGALKANRSGDSAMPRTADSAATSSTNKRKSPLSTLVSSVSITPSVPVTASSSVLERSSTIDKVSISISPLGQFRSSSPGILSSPLQ